MIIELNQCPWIRPRPTEHPPAQHPIFFFFLCPVRVKIRRAMARVSSSGRQYRTLVIFIGPVVGLIILRRPLDFLSGRLWPFRLEPARRQPGGRDGPGAPAAQWQPTHRRHRWRYRDGRRPQRQNRDAQDAHRRVHSGQPGVPKKQFAKYLDFDSGKALIINNADGAEPPGAAMRIKAASCHGISGVLGSGLRCRPVGPRGLRPSLGRPDYGRGRCSAHR